MKLKWYKKRLFSLFLYLYDSFIKKEPTPEKFFLLRFNLHPSLICQFLIIPAKKELPWQKSIV
jgi:hypothetical protein